MIRQKDGREKAYFIHYGYCPVRLPEHPERPLWRVVQAYLTRRPVEDTIRFIKQSSNVEDIRVM
ncbi:MAG: hypothetical protein LDL33_16035, partial [Desulfomonile sp.]|nr:hypothetical protein [Desulfomonile sp.]